MGTHAGGTTEPWAAALGRIPSGLFVLTARHGRQETGMLASWVQQCSFDPPQVTVAVRKGRFLLDWLPDGARFAVNVLAEGQKALVAHFGKGFEAGEPAFDGLEVYRTDGSAPMLADALACLDCRVAGRCDAGDHVLVVGRVIGGEVRHEGRPTVHVRRSGLHY
jgi:flavin reductase (DIM6/NTAB) family NADH-FMN oxidoreductase RutF